MLGAVSVELIAVAGAAGLGCTAAVLGVVRAELHAMREEIRRELRALHARLDDRSHGHGVSHVRRIR